MKDESGYSLKAGVMMIPAVIGHGGLVDAEMKQEGDGKTPRGEWPLREVLFRADRVSLPETGLQSASLNQHDGWCDDPASPHYNRRVGLPFDASCEYLWRDDHAYDVIIPMGYNDAPAIPGKGSAIFFHCLEQGRTHTDGCVAITRRAMLDLLPKLNTTSSMIIDP